MRTSLQNEPVVTQISRFGLLLGGGMHLMVLLAPLAWWPVNAWALLLNQGSLWLFLAGASAVYAADATRQTTITGPQGSRAPRSAWIDWAGNAATGLLLLLLLWISLFECFHTVYVAADDSGRAAPPWSWGAIFIGMPLMAIGAALRWLAIKRLGERFVSHLEAASQQPFQQQGVYGILRHPSEAGLIAAALGAVILLQSFYGLIVWACLLTPLVIARTRREDQFLEQVYGETHRRYRSKVRALLPWVY